MKPGDIVIGAFPGAKITKTRPAVVLSAEKYQQDRPDVILGLITSQIPQPTTPTDCEIREWRRAGLHTLSYFRLFLVTLSQREVRIIGRLSEADWRRVVACFRIGFADM